MENIFGRNLRYYRQKNGLTQERLAAYMNVVPQTISKWEQGQSSPDISMLPCIAKYLKISLDDLFDVNKGTTYLKIHNMMDRNSVLSEEEFKEARDQLIDSCANSNSKGEGLALLAELYCYMSEGYRKLAADTIKNALQEDPHIKNNHRILNYAMSGAQRDWQEQDHQLIIRFYEQHMKNYGSDEEAIYVMLDNLLENGRIEEARQVLAGADLPEHRCWYYRGRIEDCSKIDLDQNTCYSEMIKVDETNAVSWSLYADLYAKYGQYDKALEYYKKAIALEQKPRYTDSWLCVAKIAMIQENKQLEIEARTKVIEIMRDDWGIPEGDAIQKHQSRIQELMENEEENNCK